MIKLKTLVHIIIYCVHTQCHYFLNLFVAAIKISSNLISHQTNQNFNDIIRKIIKEDYSPDN